MADYPTDFEAEEAQNWQEFQDEQKERTEDMWDEQDAGEVDGSFPTARKPDSLFSLFRDVWRAPDSTKVANLDPKSELGDLGLTVRQCQKISYAADLLGEEEVASYFDALGEITLATSMSKKGWFTELFVSQKKFAQKGNLQNLQGSSEKKQGWRLFGKKKETATVEQ